MRLQMQIFLTLRLSSFRGNTPFPQVWEMARVRFRQPRKNSIGSEEQCNDKVAVEQPRTRTKRQSPEGDSPVLCGKGGNGAALQDFPVIAGLRRKNKSLTEIWPNVAIAVDI